MFAHYVRIVIVFAIDKINILLRSCILLLNIERVSYISFCKIHVSYTYLIRRTRDGSNLGRYWLVHSQRWGFSNAAVPSILRLRLITDVRLRFHSQSIALRPRYDHWTTYITTIWRYRNSIIIDCQANAWPFSVFTQKTGFWPSHCQISTDLDKILPTPIVVRNTLMSRLRQRSARGRLQAKPERLCFFVILVTHPKSYYRDDGSPRFRRQTVRVEVRTGAIVKKFRNFVTWTEPDPKQHFFRVFRIPFDYPAHSLQETVLPKPMVPMESRDSEGVYFARLESLWPGTWQLEAPEGCRKVVTWPSQ